MRRSDSARCPYTLPNLRLTRLKGKVWDEQLKISLNSSCSSSMDLRRGRARLRTMRTIMSTRMLGGGPAANTRGAVPPRPRGQTELFTIEGVAAA